MSSCNFANKHVIIKDISKQIMDDFWFLSVSLITLTLYVLIYNKLVVPEHLKNMQ